MTRRLKVPPRPGLAAMAGLAALTGSCASEQANLAGRATIVPITEAADLYAALPPVLVGPDALQANAALPFSTAANPAAA